MDFFPNINPSITEFGSLIDLHYSGSVQAFYLLDNDDHAKMLKTKMIGEWALEEMFFLKLVRPLC
jgi:hypothetical protein